MKARVRSVGVFLACLLPPVLWFAYFNFVYGAQTLACLLPDPPRHGFILAAGASAALAVAILVVFVRWRTTQRLRSFLSNSAADLGLLAGIGICLTAAAAIAIPIC